MKNEIRENSTLKSCPECGTIETVTINHKYFIVFISFLIITIAIVCALLTQTAKKPINCKTFISQKQAQDFFDANPRLYRYLDKNFNNKPCENLK